MVCEASFAGYSYVNLLCYSLLSVSKAFSCIVLFSKKIPFSQSNTSLIFFGRSPLLLRKSSYSPKGKDYLNVLMYYLMWNFFILVKCIFNIIGVSYIWK